ncbi:MAG: hypothetical protein H6750_06640 [Nitrospiraceae bacterium]|nr:hypothetical protein [Nitrospiraceae bacterium]
MSKRRRTRRHAAAPRLRKTASGTCSASPTCSTVLTIPSSSATPTTPLVSPYISYTFQSDRGHCPLTNPPFGGKEEDGIESNFPKTLSKRAKQLISSWPHRASAETEDVLPSSCPGRLADSAKASNPPQSSHQHHFEECATSTPSFAPAQQSSKPYAHWHNLLFFREGEPTMTSGFYASTKSSEGQKPDFDDQTDPL